jgi:DNA modification methylase
MSQAEFNIRSKGQDSVASIHTVCPYFTMFPLEFPLSIIRSSELKGKWVLDPFCGRGTTNFAARLSGLPSVGIDSSPVAVAIAQAKLADAEPEAVISLAKRILRNFTSFNIPRGKFWQKCFHPQTLTQLCALRQSLILNCNTDERKILRAIILGALHGPLTKSEPSYFSNQCPRTYSPKPAYSVRFWKKNSLEPPRVDSLKLCTTRSIRFLTERPKVTKGTVVHGDSRLINSMETNYKYSLIVTSPPYYGMRTYIPDQWLRNWFVGGPSQVSYQRTENEMNHSSPDGFSKQLGRVWMNVAAVSHPNARLVIRFGGINDRDAEPIEILKRSLEDTAWRLTTVKCAGSAHDGRRQATQFKGTQNAPIMEYDAYARLN